MRTVKRVRDLEAGDDCGVFGYLVAVTPWMRQEPDGTVTESSQGYWTLYFRSKPVSPRGKIRGVPTGTLDITPDDQILVLVGDQP